MDAFPGEGAEPTVIRVLVADDHVAVSMGLRLLIAGEPGLEVVAMASDGEQAVALAARERPDVVLMDLTMPLLGGLDAARQMRLVAPGCRVLILSGHVEQSVVRTAYAAGVWGYLSKDVAPDELLDAIRRTYAGETLSAGAA